MYARSDATPEVIVAERAFLLHVRADFRKLGLGAVLGDTRGIGALPLGADCAETQALGVWSDERVVVTAGVAGKTRSAAARWALAVAAAVFPIVVATCLSGCAAQTTPTASDAPPLLARSYPSTTQDPVVVARFPARVAGFEREDVTDYGDGGTNASAQYQFLRGDFVVSATFYRYPAHEEFPTLDEIYDVTREQVLGYHDSTRLLDEEETAITRGDETFRVLRATLSIERMGEPSQGPFYSELWMWQNGGELLKLRVTGPAGNPSTTALKAREFADAVDFAR